MTRYGIVIDLEKCYGCDACAAACRDAHLLPPDVVFIAVKKSGDRDRVTAPVLCMHCDAPACVPACGVEALTRDAAGVVIVDASSCTGCGDCCTACPVGALSQTNRLDTALPTAFMTEKQQRTALTWRARRERGVPSKCELCPERRRVGRPTACQAACPVGAIEVGDLNDPESVVSRLLADDRRRAIAIPKGAPRVFYLLPGGMDSADVLRLVASIG